MRRKASLLCGNIAIQNPDLRGGNAAGSIKDSGSRQLDTGFVAAISFLVTSFKVKLPEGYMPTISEADLQKLNTTAQTAANVAYELIDEETFEWEVTLGGGEPGSLPPSHPQ